MVAPGQAAPMHDKSLCPYIDLGDHRCGERFTLANAREAFSMCCGGQHGCTTFHRLNMERQYGTLDKPMPATRRVAALGVTTLTVTAHARNHSIRNLGA
jgi:hypothetical protein